MTQPIETISDPAECVIQTVIKVLRDVFKQENSDLPPIGGGSTRVRFMAGDATPLSAWDAHVADCECAEPFLWVRLMRRYWVNTERNRFGATSFPAPFIGDAPCDLAQVVALEIGVGRCASTTDPSSCGWTDYEKDAEISLDDSWRIGLACCVASKRLTKMDGLDGACATRVAAGEVVPFGPEGGILAWMGTLLVQI